MLACLFCPFWKGTTIFFDGLNFFFASLWTGDVSLRPLFWTLKSRNYNRELLRPFLKQSKKKRDRKPFHRSKYVKSFKNISPRSKQDPTNKLSSDTKAWTSPPPKKNWISHLPHPKDPSYIFSKKTQRFWPHIKSRSGTVLQTAIGPATSKNDQKTTPQVDETHQKKTVILRAMRFDLIFFGKNFTDLLSPPKGCRISAACYAWHSMQMQFPWLGK